MNKKHIAIALLAGVVLGLAYGKKVPVLATLAAKLPGAAV